MRTLSDHSAGDAEPTCPFPFILMHSPLDGVRMHPFKTALIVALLAFVVLQPFFAALLRL
jgi:hypothetical protein